MINISLQFFRGVHGTPTRYTPIHDNGRVLLSRLKSVLGERETQWEVGAENCLADWSSNLLGTPMLNTVNY